jgi:ornithine cyclodeaminase/alanine dehydrogenase
MAKVRLLSRAHVQELITMEGAISILEQAFADFAAGNVIMPVRTPITAPDYAGLSLFMPAYIPGLKALGAKVVTVYKDNPSKFDLPNVMGTIILLNPETGAPICIMDGGYLTAVRTGAVSGLATKYLARMDAKVHALFGTGVQARTQAWAVAKSRELERCLVYSVDNEEKKQAFAREAGKLSGVPTEVADDAESAVRACDILTLATSAKEPILNGEWIEPGTHINAIGSHAQGMRELDTATVVKSKVFPDSIEACSAEAGDFQIPIEEGAWSMEKVTAELGEVVAGTKTGRVADSDITLFKSVGLALQDMATATYVYKEAAERGVGHEFEF